MPDYYKTEHYLEAHVDFEGDINIEVHNCDIYLTRADLVKMIDMIDETTGA
jgi:hypothetical protein